MSQYSKQNTISTNKSNHGHNNKINVIIIHDWNISTIKQHICLKAFYNNQKACIMAVWISLLKFTHFFHTSWSLLSRDISVYKNSDQHKKHSKIYYASFIVIWWWMTSQTVLQNKEAQHKMSRQLLPEGQHVFIRNRETAM